MRTGWRLQGPVLRSALHCSRIYNCKIRRAVANNPRGNLHVRVFTLPLREHRGALSGSLSLNRGREVGAMFVPGGGRIGVAGGGGDALPLLEAT